MKIALQREGTMAKNLEISYLLDFYGDVLTDKQREAMEEYYNADLSLAEIAEGLGITRQGVRDAVKRGEATLVELEEKIGAAGRYRALADQLDQLEHLLRDIRFYATDVRVDGERIAALAGEALSTLQSVRDFENQ